MPAERGQQDIPCRGESGEFGRHGVTVPVTCSADAVAALTRDGDRPSTIPDARDRCSTRVRGVRSLRPSRAERNRTPPWILGSACRLAGVSASITYVAEDCLE